MGGRLNEWNVGYLLAMVLGVDTFTAGVAAEGNVPATPNSHVLTWADNTNPASLTNIFLYDTTAIRRRFLDMGLKTLVLTGSETGSIKFKATWIGTGRYQDGAIAGAVPSLEASPTYLRGSDAAITLGPSGGDLISFYPRVRSWEITLDSGVEAQRRCGAGVYAAFIANGNPMMKLKLSLDADATTDIRDYAEENTELGINFAIPIGTTGFSLNLLFPRIVLPKDDLAEMAAKYVGYTIELDEQTILKPANGEVFTATLLNSTPKYLQTYVAG